MAKQSSHKNLTSNYFYLEDLELSQYHVIGIFNMYWDITLKVTIFIKCVMYH